MWLLTSLGYTGAYTIEREVGEDAVGDTRKAVSFLRRLKPVPPGEDLTAKGTSEYTKGRRDWAGNRPVAC